VFVNADGFKKSIASPGVGNYITMAKAAAATQNVIGAEGLQQRSYVQAHGTGTPQNRITESHILSEIAKTWQISRWPVTALKSYIGHSLASSSADQLVSSLGVWKYGIIPGILSTEQIADDVHQDNLEFLLQHKEVGSSGMDAVLLNSKGFGGNNASASVLAPHIALRMLSRKHGKAALSAWQQRNESVTQKAADYDQATIEGRTTAIYRFDHNVLGGSDLQIDQHQMRLNGQMIPIDLQVDNSYSDMCD
jgi:acetoacetyl-[acyl-carrier protein] synthase